MSNWTQPLCDDDWRALEGDRRPVRLRDPAQERCCRCGQLTTSGIYYRVDPATVPHPTMEDR